MHYNGCNYLSMLGLKFNHLSKRGHRGQPTIVTFGCKQDKAVSLYYYDINQNWNSRLGETNQHYSDVIITLSNQRRLDFCSNVCSGADQRKYQNSASLAFVRGNHRSPVNFSRKGPVPRKMFHLMTSS